MGIDRIFPTKWRALYTKDTKGPKDSGHTFTGKGSRLKILNKGLINALLHFEHL